jgi:DHA1 family bicyclomycin/chloramphenicol resistance-like MFS transporter
LTHPLPQTSGVSAAPHGPIERPSEPYRGVWLTILLSVLLGFASISTDFYLPALPSMASSLDADQRLLELTISGYLLGFSVGQLFWGPLSDRYGRKVPLLAGIAIFIIGSAGCALSTDAAQMIGWRLVQALGASAGVVLARAMVRDLFDHRDAARVLSTLMMIMAIAPMAGPIIGAQILAISSWQAIFWTLVAVGAATLFGVFRTSESLPRSSREDASLAQAFSRYAWHLGNVRLLAHAGANGFYSAGIFAYVAGSPFVFIEYFGLSPEQYGLAFASGIIGIMLANATNRRLVSRVSSNRLLLVGTGTSILAGIALVVAASTGIGGLLTIGAALFVFVTMNGFVAANAIAGGLSSVHRATGSAAALIGFMQYGGAMLGSAAVGFLANGTPLPMAGAVLAFSVLSGACALSLTLMSQPPRSSTAA